MNNIVYLTNFSKAPIVTNVVDRILTSVVSNYEKILTDCNVDVEDPNIAFDIATIQFLLHGMAHRSQGEDHPSQSILDALRQNILGS
jgi:hypothetical protein